MAGGAAAFVDGRLAGALVGGALSLVLRLVLDALAGAVAFAGACRLLKLDESLYLEGLLWRVLGRVSGAAKRGQMYRPVKRGMRE